MNLHEFQGKSILKSYGVAIQEGKVAQSVSEALQVAKELSLETGTKWFVVKAQIHAGGRGKGKVIETGCNGVVIAKGIDQVEEKVKGILGGHLVTAHGSSIIYHKKSGGKSTCHFFQIFSKKKENKLISLKLKVCMESY